jgi:hypothetical protein
MRALDAIGPRLAAGIAVAAAAMAVSTASAQAVTLGSDLGGGGFVTPPCPG